MGDLLQWAVIAFIISIVAGALGFSGVARGVGKAAQWLFGGFLLIALLLVVLFVLGVGAIF